MLRIVLSLRSKPTLVTPAVVPTETKKKKKRWDEYEGWTREDTELLRDIMRTETPEFNPEDVQKFIESLLTIGSQPGLAQKIHQICLWSNPVATARILALVATCLASKRSHTWSIRCVDTDDHELRTWLQTVSFDTERNIAGIWVTAETLAQHLKAQEPNPLWIWPWHPFRPQWFPWVMNAPHGTSFILSWSSLSLYTENIARANLSSLQRFLPRGVSLEFKNPIRLVSKAVSSFSPVRNPSEWKPWDGKQAHGHFMETTYRDPGPWIQAIQAALGPETPMLIWVPDRKQYHAFQSRMEMDVSTPSKIRLVNNTFFLETKQLLLPTYRCILVCLPAQAEATFHPFHQRFYDSCLLDLYGRANVFFAVNTRWPWDWSGSTTISTTIASYQQLMTPRGDGDYDEKHTPRRWLTEPHRSTLEPDWSVVMKSQIETLGDQVLHWRSRMEETHFPVVLLCPRSIPMEKLVGQLSQYLLTHEQGVRVEVTSHRPGGLLRIEKEAVSSLTMEDSNSEDDWYLEQKEGVVTDYVPYFGATFAPFLLWSRFAWYANWIETLATRQELSLLCINDPVEFDAQAIRANKIRHLLVWSWSHLSLWHIPPDAWTTMLWVEAPTVDLVAVQHWQNPTSKGPSLLLYHGTWSAWQDLFLASMPTAPSSAVASAPVESAWRLWNFFSSSSTVALSSSQSNPAKLKPYIIFTDSIEHQTEIRSSTVSMEAQLDVLIVAQWYENKDRLIEVADAHSIVLVHWSSIPVAMLTEILYVFRASSIAWILVESSQSSASVSGFMDRVLRGVRGYEVLMKNELTNPFEADALNLLSAAQDKARRFAEIDSLF